VRAEDALTYLSHAARTKDVPRQELEAAAASAVSAAAELSAPQQVLLLKALAGLRGEGLLVAGHMLVPLLQAVRSSTRELSPSQVADAAGAVAALLHLLQQPQQGQQQEGQEEGQQEQWPAQQQEEEQAFEASSVIANGDEDSTTPEGSLPSNAASNTEASTDVEPSDSSSSSAPAIVEATQLLHSACDALDQQQLRALSCRQLVLLLQALVAARAALPEPWLAACLAAVQRKLGAATAHDLVLLLASLAALAGASTSTSMAEPCGVAPANSSWPAAGTAAASTASVSAAGEEPSTVVTATSAAKQDGSAAPSGHLPGTSSSSDSGQQQQQQQQQQQALQSAVAGCDGFQADVLEVLQEQLLVLSPAELQELLGALAALGWPLGSGLMEDVQHAVVCAARAWKLGPSAVEVLAGLVQQVHVDGTRA
jgi:hypothetical protein